MKLYTDVTGKFQMFIPINWEYKNPSFKDQNGPNSFGQYDNMIGAFQISCKPVNNYISALITQKGLLIQKSEHKLRFSEDFVSSKDFHTYLWTCAVDDHFILITYILGIKICKKKTAIQELMDVRKTIDSLKFVKPKHREAVLAARRYSLFLFSMAAAIDLRNKALENGSFIESVVLTANRIDAMLRLAIILTDQIKNNNSEIDPSILFQSEQDKPVMERQIYKLALDKNIINQNVFNKLECLYKERNKVIHRYIITDIRTQDVLNIAKDYYEIENTIDKIILKLESEQFRLKVGINGGNDKAPDAKLQGTEIEELLNSIRDKHGSIKWRKSNGEVK